MQASGQTIAIIGRCSLNATIVTPIAAWLACFAVLNVIVKTLSLTISTESLLEQALSMAKSSTFYVAGILYVTCAFLYFLSLNRLPLSTAGPAFMILGVITTAVIGSSVFGEPLGFVKLLGMIVCIAGVGLIFYGSAG